MQNNIEKFFIELHVANADVEEELFFLLKKYAYENNLPTLIANDSHYLTKGDIKIWNILSSNRSQGDSASKKEYKPIRNDDFYVKTYDEIYEDVLRCNYMNLLYDHSESDYRKFSNDENFRYHMNNKQKIETIQEYFDELPSRWGNYYDSEIEIIEQKSGELFNGFKIIDQETTFDWYGSWEARKLKMIEIPNSHNLLRKRLYSGLLEMFKTKDEIPPEYIERIKKEIDIAVKTNNISYFYIIAKFLDRCKEKGIMLGMGRGSAASLLICYLIGACKVNPMMYPFIIERAMNVDRPKLMDVDLDFANTEVKEAQTTLREVFGDEKVMNISTYGYIGVKQALGAVFRFLKIDHQLGIQISKRISKFEQYDEEGNVIRSKSTDVQMLQLLSESYEINDYQLMNNNSKDTIMYYINSMIDTINNTGVHPAGMLVCDTEIWKKLPVTRVGEVLCSAFDMRILEKLNGLKIDVLSIASNDLVRYGLVKKYQHHKVDLEKLLF